MHVGFLFPVLPNCFQVLVMRFTKTAIEKLDAPLKDTFIWDDDTKGFGVRLSPKGSKSYLVQYRARNRTRRQSLGSFSRVTLDDARRQAKIILGNVASGRDPGASREILTTSLTLMEVAEIFLNERVNLKLKSTTKRQYNQVISQYILPKLGGYKIYEISRGDIAKLQLDLQSIPAQANCVIRVLSRLFSFAEQREFTNGKPNPCQHIEIYEEKKRNRYLDEVELKRLWETLEHVES